MPHNIDAIIIILNTVIFSLRRTAPRIMAKSRDVSRSDDTIATGAWRQAHKTMTYAR
jgi:hypothetical protein